MSPRCQKQKQPNPFSSSIARLDEPGDGSPINQFVVLEGPSREVSNDMAKAKARARDVVSFSLRMKSLLTSKAKAKDIGCTHQAKAMVARKTLAIEMETS